jgi:ABC-2 type transport system ATP-binding protein
MLRLDDDRKLICRQDCRMIVVDSLTKSFGNTVAVSDLSFRVRPGIVTGFLGPNGAGKSTTMRIILGLDRPTFGSATVNGKHLAEHTAPLREVGGLLDAGAVHPKRSASNHLRVLAATNGITDSRVDFVLRLVGLAGVGHRPTGKFSLGMSQRLGIASALLGDPGIVVLDEPVNGLDPEGILWIRSLLHDLANEGRTVFVSSHLMAEMSMISEHFIIVGAGQLIADVSRQNLLETSSRKSVFIRSPDIEALQRVLAGDGVQLVANAPDTITANGITAAAVGRAAAANRIEIYVYAEFDTEGRAA